MILRKVTSVRQKLGYKRWLQVKDMLVGLPQSWIEMVLEYASNAPCEGEELYDRLVIAIRGLKKYNELRENYIKAIDKLFELSKATTIHILFKLDKNVIKELKTKLK